MPAARVDDAKLLAGLTRVFCLHGFEGASLSRISEATGLQRASLYHRFPGGKEEMAEAVLDETDRQFEEVVLAPLAGKGAPAARIRRMAEEVGRHYDEGRQSCLLDTLSLGEGSSELRRHVKRSFAAWRDALVAVAREGGATPAVAKRRAEEALVVIQGSLVLARGLGDRKAFQRVLAGLPGLLLKGRLG